MDFPELRAAGEALRTVCDGAQSRDDQGYNGFDRSFADSLLAKAPWTARQASAFHKMLLKYRKQLAGLGHPYEGIPQPDATPTFTPQVPGMDPSIFQTPVKPNIGLARHPTYGLQFTVEFPLNYSVKDAFRANIPVTIWQPEDMRWVVPGKHAEALLAFAKTVGWTWTDEAFTEATHRGVTLAEKVKEQAFAVKASSASDSQFMSEFRSKSGMALFPFQRAGVEYMVRKERTYMADEMGTGKTIQTLAALHHTQAFPALIACPGSVIMVWQRHAAEWLPGKKVALAPASPQGCDIYIGSYERVTKAAERLKSIGFKTIVCDEAVVLKNRKAKRTEAFCGSTKDGIFQPGLLQSARYRWLLTGTPVRNRPAELIQPLIGLDRLKDFGGFKAFASRYCGWIQGVPGSIDGSQNLTELNQALRSHCWVRRLKEDVFKEMPAKMFSHVPLELSSPARYQKALHHLQEFLGKHPGEAEALVQMTTLRRVAAEEKLAAAIQWVEDFLESGEKIVILGWHNEPLRAIYDAFKSQAVILTGETSAGDRVKAIDAFQDREDCRVFVGNIQAAGQGITLTAASNIAIFELPWTPDLVDQGIARIHRIGQKASSVTVHYLLAADTIDEDIADLIDAKRAVMTGAQDGKAVDVKDLITRLVRTLGPSKPGVVPLSKVQPDTEAWA